MSEDQKLAALALATATLAATYLVNIRRVKKATKRLEEKIDPTVAVIDWDHLFAQMP